MQDRITPEEDVIKRAREEIQQKTGKTPEELYEEREKRVTDTIQMKEPDRVPVMLRGGNFPVRYLGVSPSVVHYEPEVYKQAVIRTLLDFEPDLYDMWMPTTTSGPAMEILDTKQWRWPGGPPPAVDLIQIIDQESMKEDEYDLLITDPAEFMLRYYLPRSFGALESLSKIPTPSSWGRVAFSILDMAAVFTKPEFQKMAQDLLKAGHEQEKFRKWDEEICDCGFPLLVYPSGIVFSPPFDWIANYLRGMRGIMVDMFERPDKILAACEKILEWRLAWSTPEDPEKRGSPRRVGGGALHFSSDRFLSKKQFETFCWPTYKKSLLAAIDLGFIPFIHFEGKCDDRVEYLLEMPKGKCLPLFQEVDMFRAKEILRDHTCIMGDVPAALLQLGSPQEVEDYCKKLIKVCGKGGGFILSSSNTELAKPANIKAMIDSVKKYGRL